jgi:hypothetical protein
MLKIRKKNMPKLAYLMVVFIFIGALVFSPRKTEATPADLNTDGKVDMKDLALLAKNFGSHTNSSLDLVPDGEINIKDIVFLLKRFGSIYDLNRDRKINMKDLCLLEECFGTRKGDKKYNAYYDFNNDSEINIKDIAILTQNWEIERP